MRGVSCTCRRRRRKENIQTECHAVDIYAVGHKSLPFIEDGVCNGSVASNPRMSHAVIAN